MRFEFKPSFERSIKSFPPPEKSEIKEAAAQLIDILSGPQSKLISKERKPFPHSEWPPEDDAYQTFLEDEFDFEIVLASKGEKRLVLPETTRLWGQPLSF